MRLARYIRSFSARHTSVLVILIELLANKGKELFVQRREVNKMEKFVRTIVDEVAMNRMMTRMSHEIIEKNKGIQHCILVGIHTRGVYVAERIAAKIKNIEGVCVPCKQLDITSYRDDFRKTTCNNQMQSSDRQDTSNFKSHLGCIENKKVILVDDVLYTGRTIRAAMDALMDCGRPQSIQLAVLIDRGHRELPISPNFVGKNVPTAKTEKIVVGLKEVDQKDEVTIV